MVRAHGFVSGRVQGVWFRESTRRRAVELGVAGWVRNLPDGRVEAEFVGPAAAVRAACKFVTAGPPHARVDDVKGFEIEPVQAATGAGPDSFLIR
ncbi:MAG: acylphosphatase [bacterium]|nr:acylphosphatase [bacterium]